MANTAMLQNYKTGQNKSPTANFPREFHAKLALVHVEEAPIESFEAVSCVEKMLEVPVNSVAIRNTYEFHLEPIE
jgi:hypothetical protein